jgi:putative endonuclease
MRIGAEVVDMQVANSVGRYGERIAARHLESEGMTVLERNWRCRHGEIDIIALDDGCLVVCEVKTRRSTACGSPLESVTPEKFRRLRRLAVTWLAEQDESYPEVRVDVVGVVRPLRGPARIEHVRGVV